MGFNHLFFLRVSRKPRHTMNLKSGRLKCLCKRVTYFTIVKFWWQNLDIKILERKSCIYIQLHWNQRASKLADFFIPNTSINLVWGCLYCVLTTSHKYAGSEGKFFFFEKWLHVGYLNFLNWIMGYVSTFLETLHRYRQVVKWILESNQAISAFKCNDVVTRRVLSGQTHITMSCLQNYGWEILPCVRKWRWGSANKLSMFFTKALSSGYRRGRRVCNLRGRLSASRLLASFSFLIPTRLSGICVCFQPHRWAERKRIVLLFENYRVRNLDEELASFTVIYHGFPLYFRPNFQ